MTALDHDRCYRALATRDSRFDGQFIAGVHTTGIYCRPSCPATTPRPHNVRFYPTAAAAHEAGLRACKRCQPDAVPGNPQWNLRDDLAGRAMRLILDGTVERDGVGGLARRLGYSSRHLTRVLTEELGAGPLALARAHRAESARALLASTDLPVGQIAFASGFSSIRQCNDTVREVYGVSPTALRDLARRDGLRVRATDATAHAASGTTVTVRLAARDPFDGVGIMRYLADHAIAGVEEVTADSIRRWVRLPGGLADVTVSLDPQRAGVICTARLEQVADLAPLTARIRRWFDLDADAAGIDAALGADAVLGPLVASAPGVRIPGALDPREALLRTIVGQQVSLAGARTLLGRLVAASADRAPEDTLVDPAAPDALLPFPTPARLADVADQLAAPVRRRETLRDLAVRLADGTLSIDAGDSADDLRARLRALPGIGPWTADYVTLRALGAPDILLADDLVLLRALRHAGLASTAREAAALGAQWAPWRSYATLHLWRWGMPLATTARRRDNGAPTREPGRATP